MEDHENNQNQLPQEVGHVAPQEASSSCESQACAPESVDSDQIQAGDESEVLVRVPDLAGPCYRLDPPAAPVETAHFSSTPSKERKTKRSSKRSSGRFDRLMFRYYFVASLGLTVILSSLGGFVLGRMTASSPSPDAMENLEVVDSLPPDFSTVDAEAAPFQENSLVEKETPVKTDADFPSWMTGQTGSEESVPSEESVTSVVYSDQGASTGSKAPVPASTPTTGAAPSWSPAPSQQANGSRNAFSDEKIKAFLSEQSGSVATPAYSTDRNQVRSSGPVSVPMPNRQPYKPSSRAGFSGYQGTNNSSPYYPRVANRPSNVQAVPVQAPNYRPVTPGQTPVPRPAYQPYPGSNASARPIYSAPAAVPPQGQSNATNRTPLPTSGYSPQGTVPAQRAAYPSAGYPSVIQ